MERRPTAMEVVAAAITDSEDRLLLQQCLPHKRHAGLWEFPGGKVENGESQRFALCREVSEELGVALAEIDLKPAGSANDLSADDGREIVLFLYTCRQWSGEPHGREGQNWGWFTLDEAARLPLPPMDRMLLSGLRSKSLF